MSTALISGLVATPALAATAPTPTSVDSSPTTTQPPQTQPSPTPVTAASNEASAIAAARAGNQKVEITGDRTATSTTYANPDGSLTQVTAAGPVRYQDDKGNWKDIDLSLVQAKDGSVSAASAEHPAVLPASADGGLGLWSPAGSFTLTHANAQHIQAAVTSSSATYSAAMGGADLIEKPLVDGVEESVRLSSAGQGNGYTDVLTVPDGVTARQGGPGVEFVDSSGAVVALFGSGIANDSAPGVPGGQGEPTGVNVKLVSQANDQVSVSVSVDHKWFTDPQRVFPVVIDPSFVTNGNTNGGTDTFITNQPGIGSQWTNGQLSVGYNSSNGYYNRTLLHLGLFGTEAANVYVNSATLSVEDEVADACTAKNVSVLGLTGGFNSSTVWSNQPGHDATATVSKSFAYGFTGCAAQYVNFDVTSLVNTWMNTSRTNYGFELMSTETPTAAGFKRFYSSEQGPTRAPTLSVTYDHEPNKPVLMWPPNNGVFNSTSGRLAASVSDQDNNSLTSYFTVTDSATHVVVINGGQSATVPGQMAYYSLAGHGLLDGHSYDWNVKSDDHFSPVFGPTSSTYHFSIDATPPPAPGVSSTTYTSGGWHGAGGSGTFNFSDTATDLNHYVYGLDQNPPTTSIGTGVSSVALTPGDGWHTLYVAAVDNAGNVSSATAYSFGATPAVTSPTEGATTQGSVALDSVAAPGLTSVTYNYRRSSSDSWTAIPAADVTQAGSGIGSWPVTFSSTGNSTPPELVWNLANTLSNVDGPVQIQVCFGSTCSTGATDATLDENEFGQSFATSSIGPGSLSLLTGNFSVSAADASVSTPNGGLTLERTFNSRTPSTASILGPGWQASLPDVGGSSDWPSLSDTGAAVTLTASDGSTLSFAKAGSTYTPTGDASGSGLTLVPSTSGTNGPDTFTLTDLDGNATQFYHGATSFTSAASLATPHAYVVQLVTQSGSSQLTTYSYDGSGRPTQVLAPPAPATNCTNSGTPFSPDPSHWTTGCRALQMSYNGSGDLTSVTFVTNAGSSVLFIDVACFSYDVNGRLQAAWDPRVGTAGTGNHPVACGTPVLATSYGYDATSGRLTSVTPPGLAPWTFGYDGSGRLSTVSRTHDAAHGGGTESTTVAYGLSLTADGSHPEYRANMTLAATATWAQADNPVTATAIFPPGHTISSTDLRDGLVHYLDVDGREVNTADYSGTGAAGWHISTTEYDPSGRVLRTLTASNREEALSPGGAAGSALGLPSDSATASTWVDTRYLYATAADGVVDPTDTYGPYHEVMLPPTTPSAIGPGTPTLAREHVQYTYDTGTETGHPAGGTLHLVIKTTDGASQSPGTVPTNEKDTRETDNAYALSASAPDNVGWSFGEPMKVTTDPSGLNLSTITRYDVNTGLPIETRMPSDPTGTGAGTTLTIYYSSGAVAAPDAECGSKPQWAGLVCKTRAAADPGVSGLPGRVVKETTNYDYFDRPVTVVESVVDAAGVTQTRTTSTTYENSGYSPRRSTKSMTGGLGTSIPVQTTTYDPSTGLPVATSASATATQSATSATTGYDDFGGVTSYNEDTNATGASANVVTTQYDSAGRISTISDAHTTRTYTYDAGGEHRDLPTALNVSGVSAAFTASYDADGALVAQTYPTTSSPITQTYTYDESGHATSVSYLNSASSVSFSDQELASIHGQEMARTTTNGTQAYNYDAAGRLTAVQDAPSGSGCTTRTYTYDVDTNRLSQSSYGPAVDNSCQNSAGVISVSHSYDSADRLQSAGGDAGTTYDAFGRTTTVPVANTGSGGSDLSVSYYTNDLVRSESQGTPTRTFTWSLDANGRLKTWTDATGGVTTATKTNHYDDGFDDSPAWIAESADSSQWTQNIADLGGRLALTITNVGTEVFQLTDLVGSVAATTPDGVTQPTYQAADEFGVPRDSSPRRYSWLGAAQRSADGLAAVVLMGARLYEPVLGRFLQPDPVPGGSANSYDYATADPVNSSDLSGLLVTGWATGPAFKKTGKWHAWTDVDTSTCNGDGTDGGLCTGMQGFVRTVSWLRVSYFYDPGNGLWIFSLLAIVQFQQGGQFCWMFPHICTSIFHDKGPPDTDITRIRVLKSWICGGPSGLDSWGVREGEVIMWDSINRTGGCPDGDVFT